MAEIVDSREILARVRAERAEPPRPLMREMSPPDPFPVEALGMVLANAAVGIQDRTRAPIAICGQSVMAAATLATQAHADVRLPAGQLRPLSNFFATVAVTGERKTAADAEALWPIRKREEALRELYGPARQEYENAREAWECARAHATKAGKGNASAIKAALAQLGPPPNEPLLPFLAVTEPTIEGLVKVFAKGWPSLGIFSDEGGMFIRGLLDILALPLTLVAGKQNELAPRELKLTAEARQQWIAFHDHVEHDLREGGPLWAIRGLGNKIPEIVVRLAGVLTLIEDTTAQEITADALEQGIALAEHYMAEALRLFEATQTDAELVRAQTLARWLMTQWDHPVVGLPEIYRLGPNSVRDMKTARRLVGILESHGHLSRIEGGAQVGDNFRREAWEIAGRKARE